jgi:hypothetical protein
MHSDPLKQAFSDIQSMMGQARQDAETTLLDETNAARVKLGDKKRAVLVALVGNRDTLLDRVGEATTPEQKATLEKWIPLAEKWVSR